MWHVSSRSGVASLRTAVHLLLTYLLITWKLYRRICKNLTDTDRTDRPTSGTTGGRHHGCRTSFAGAGAVLSGQPVTPLVDGGRFRTPQPPGQLRQWCNRCRVATSAYSRDRHRTGGEVQLRNKHPPRRTGINAESGKKSLTFSVHPLNVSHDHAV